MSETSGPFFTGIDLGTSKVRCIVGLVDDKGIPEIIGYGQRPVTGMRRGTVAHAEEVAEAVTHALQEAERVSGKIIKAATVNINGSHVEGVDSRGVVAVSSADREVRVSDRLRVEEAASVMKMPANREIVQVFPKAYKLDGQGNIKNPIGMQGVRLEVDTHIVTASVPDVKNVEKVMDVASVGISHRTVSSLAAAEAVLSRQQREAGTAVIDVGAGTTNIIVVEDAEVQHIAVIPVGGMHVTNDLAIGLKTDLHVAEEVKVKYASLTDTTRVTATVKDGGQQHTFSMEDVRMIVEARIEELLEIIDQELEKIGRSRKLPGGVVFVGGGSKIAGLATFAKEKLELPARKGTIVPMSGLSDVVKDVEYAAPIGLMLLDMLLSEQSEGTNEAVAYNSTLNTISKLFKKIRRS